MAQASVDPATTPPTCKWVDTLILNPAMLATSGLHRIKTRVIMEQPSDITNPPKGVRHARALFSGAVVLQNGGTKSALNPADPEENELRGTGWGTGGWMGGWVVGCCVGSWVGGAARRRLCVWCLPACLPPPPSQLLLPAPN